jgi:eukaryotic-like serine/threonine-protein kinase
MLSQVPWGEVVMGDPVSRAQPLRPSDPALLGAYELVGRLGEGGMGTVYLARDPAGALVAVKVIRRDLADDAEFRRRFRGEVERAQQVPPFCTAEVLDADPDHEWPYLVVEYVDGPSLAAVVGERGPLSPANLHGLAIGVATALTAIHGAGVIHRDLKPNNVLLAPGSPKVIDFGIARAVHGGSGATTADRVIGTVAYMAPERLGPGGSALLTPAADIFAWGAVVAYAGAGRPPYGADAPPVVAVRILTQPPDLDWLTGPLRELVEESLAKDPAQRPTARELLDRLLSVGPSRGPVAAALAGQPALLRAAEDAQAATDHQPVRQLVAEVPAVHPTRADATDRFAAGTPAPSRARRVGRLAASVLTVVLVAAVALAAGWKLRPQSGSANPGPPTASSRPPAVNVSPSIPAGSELILADQLIGDGQWKSRDDKANQASCAFSGALVVTKQNVGPFRCPGPPDQVGDFGVFVDVRLLSRDSCAGIWFRFTMAGYALRICHDGYFVVTHGATGPTAVATLHAYPFNLTGDGPVRVGIVAEGPVLRFFRDGHEVGTWRDPTFAQGRIALGVFQDRASDRPPFSVSFANVEVWSVRN